MRLPRRITNVRLLDQVEDALATNVHSLANFNDYARAAMDAFIASDSAPLPNRQLAFALGGKIGERTRSVAMSHQLYDHYTRYAEAHGATFGELVDSSLAALLLSIPVESHD